MKYPYTLYENSSILLPDVSIPALPEEITFEGHKLYVKDEFHITLVSVEYLAKLIEPDNPEETKSKILNEFDTFTKTTSLETYKISNDFRFVQTESECTIIVMAEVNNLGKLFDRFNEKFSLELPRQQTHVTLYRYPKDFIGVAIPSPEALESISKQIEFSF